MELRDTIKAQLGDIQNTARQIAVLDVLTALAEAADNYNYVRPVLTANGQIDIREGRHPLVERLLQRELFVPNDTKLNHNDCEIMLITGPNMAGKSTYMRQTALLVLMAQIGSFVPAREAYISPVDRIFTRIGASDDLVSGQSTFMVEMNEVAQILKYATSNSLVILDEIGRGTSTFDGMSIARAVIEHMEAKIHAKTLFATHYHELTDLENEKSRISVLLLRIRGEILPSCGGLLLGQQTNPMVFMWLVWLDCPRLLPTGLKRFWPAWRKTAWILWQRLQEYSRKRSPCSGAGNGMGSLLAILSPRICLNWML